jgi:crotonobetainyl-CoA:carnitine CoA-transferase CaiB-like acyl-CoA transferase
VVDRDTGDCEQIAGLKIGLAIHNSSPHRLVERLTLRRLQLSEVVGISAVHVDLALSAIHDDRSRSVRSCDRGWIDWGFGLGGFDSAVFWARAGAALGATPTSRQDPSPMPSPAYGDTMAGLVLAGGIAAALAGRERTGEPSVVDLSLLGLGSWAMGSAIAGSLQTGAPWQPMQRTPATNALAGTYRTGDDRFLSLALLKGFYEWPDLCRCLGRPELVEDPRFDSPDHFIENTPACVALLDEIFGSASLEVWSRRLADLEGVWAPFQDTLEVAADPQILANGHLADVVSADQSPFQLVGNPVQFDETPASVSRAPEAGEHTERALLDLGFDWETIASLKRKGAVQ